MQLCFHSNISHSLSPCLHVTDGAADAGASGPVGADKNERVYFNLGMLAMDDKNIEEAENWFKRAVHLKQDFRSALFNLALLLADDDRPLEAAPFLNQLVKYHPDHIKGLILLGDIYINNIKDLDAAENVIEFYYHPHFVPPPPQHSPIPFPLSQPGETRRVASGPNPFPFTFVAFLQQRNPKNPPGNHSLNPTTRVLHQRISDDHHRRRHCLRVHFFPIPFHSPFSTSIYKFTFARGSVCFCPRGGHSSGLRVFDVVFLFFSSSSSSFLDGLSPVIPNWTIILSAPEIPVSHFPSHWPTFHVSVLLPSPPLHPPPFFGHWRVRGGLLLH